MYEPRLVNSADGTKICADAAGNRAADCPVIVLIHGFSVIKEAFDSMFEDPKWVHHAFLVSAAMLYEPILTLASFMTPGSL